MKHTITLTVENQPGVLARIVGLISGRGYNIETLNVGPTQDPAVSRMTMQVPGDDRVLEQVTRQLAKLVDVQTVTDLTNRNFMNRELMLIKVAASRERRSELIELAGLFDGRIISVQGDEMVVQVAGDKNQLQDLLALLEPLGILDIARTGVIAIERKNAAPGGDHE
jgi:acetolactate synthase I/III small subunit